MFEKSNSENQLPEDSFLRSLAMELFDRCLAEQNLMLMETFIEHQLTEEPIPFELLIGLRDDLGSRMRELRGKRFELRAGLVQEVSERCGVDIAPFLPMHSPEQITRMQARQITELITAQKQISIETLLNFNARAESFLQNVRRVQHELELTAGVHALISDWLDGYLATLGYQDWLNTTHDRGYVQ